MAVAIFRLVNNCNLLLKKWRSVFKETIQILKRKFFRDFFFFLYMAKKIIYEIIKQIWRQNCWPSSLLKARTFIHIICDWVSFGRLPTTPIIRQHHRSFTSVLMLQLQICRSSWKNAIAIYKYVMSS